MWYVYILKCRNNALYTGITTNLEERFKAHATGRGARFTRSFKPTRMLFSEEHPSKSSALAREAFIKKLPREKKIEMIKAGAKHRKREM